MLLSFQFNGTIRTVEHPISYKELFRREFEIYTHIAALILYKECSKLLQPTYAAVLSMECAGDYGIE